MARHLLKTWGVLARTILLLWAVILLLPAASPAEDLDERISVGSGAKLRIELDHGSVKVVSHDAREVRIEARARGLGASAFRFRLRRANKVLVLTGEAEAWLELLQAGPRIQVRAWVPPDCEVEVQRVGSGARLIQAQRSR